MGHQLLDFGRAYTAGGGELNNITADLNLDRADVNL